MAILHLPEGAGWEDALANRPTDPTNQTRSNTEMLSFKKNTSTVNEGDYDVVEPGIYRLRLRNVEEVAGTFPNPKTGEYDPRLKWTFDVVEEGFEAFPNGEQRTVRTWTSQKTGKNKETGKFAKLVQFAEALRGAPYSDDDEINLPDLLGQEATGLLTVSADGKWNNIDSLAPIRRGKPTTPAKAQQPVKLDLPKDAISDTLFGDEDEDTPQPSEKEALGFPRRRTAALGKCKALDGWGEEIEANWRIELWGLEKAKTPFPKLSTADQYREVLQLEAWADGSEELPVAF